jgi:hypothetical protein
MTKEQYFEMCEALGSEPLSEEIPVEMDDFPIEIQEVFSVYYKLRDDWDYFAGIYKGKSYDGLVDILDILDIEKKNRKYLLEWIAVLDRFRSELIDAQRPKSE